MSFWLRLLRFLGIRQASDHLSFPLDVDLVRSLQDLADQEQRSEAEIAAELLSQALAQRGVNEAGWQRWRTLSAREQQVAALICLGYTNQQIAARLVISSETVKTHVHKVLQKFGLHSKAGLRKALSDWDFSAWREGF